ncbi:hypothetical protein [Noviherbaspirillum galbum]|uniref:Uncharacterized protein n=1 Tax=Noviherbaspirillum galbum TaxID=2709383 RepID=A0A6B3SHK1_9BURK|nr:hypothetical protein [Noviherbaspirillum galbum]NEX60148.1 hypothetical protein [Noviherbaspirillum galbum]
MQVLSQTGATASAVPGAQAEMFTAQPAEDPPKRRTPPKTVTRDVPVVDGSMFPLNDDVSPDRFWAVFVSGASAYYDAKGLSELGQAIGVVADKLVSRVILLLRTHLRRGGKLFIDSGAYGAFTAWDKGKAASPLADFAEVFATYDQVIDDLSPALMDNVMLVMPDVLRNPEWSLQLLQEHRKKILGYIDRGIHAVVPAQRGPVPAGETVNRVARILGTRRFTVGIPSAAAAMSLADIATIRHDRFHILGRGSMGLPLFQRTYAFLEQNPGALVSADANRLRTNMPEVSYRHAELRDEFDGTEWSGPFDDTEIICDLLDQRNMLTKRQVEMLAQAYGITDRATVLQWIKAHKSGNGLRELLEEIDPELDWLWHYALRASLGEAAKKALSARLRAVAVSDVFDAMEAA